jgi:glycosyltransferase involved in cell wall biosynthesis
MKILIDARLYGPKSAKGLGRYLEQIINGLKIQDSTNEYVILLTKENWDEFTETTNFKKVLAPWRWYTLAEQFKLPRLIKQQKPDLVCFPHFNVPFFYRGPFILTIHDLLLRRYPSRRASTLGPVKYWFKNLAYRLIIVSAIKRAQKVIAVSQFTKSEILKYYPKISPGKIVVIYEGLSQLEVDSGQKLDDNEVLLRYNITKPFLLYVGNAYPHKNLEKLLLVFQKIMADFSGQLVLVGNKDYFYFCLEERAKKIGLPLDQILFLGYVPDAELACLYRQAMVYVFPSLYEGFGLPPLEAMNYGLPVVASDIPCLREVCGQAIEYFDPQDTDSVVEKINLVLNNELRREGLKQLGFEQVKKYNWSLAVTQHLETFNKLKVRSKE